MDLQTPPKEVLRKTMKRLAWQNRISGNNWLVFYFLKKLIKNKPSVSIVDIGTGIADLPEYIAKRLRKQGTEFQIIGVDTNEAVLNLAQSTNDIMLVHGELTSITEKPDVIIASQMLHHLNPDEAISFFREANAKAKIGIIISDFSRSRFWYWVVRLFMYATFADAINRHDGPLSILRAYTDSEIRTMLSLAGIQKFTIHNVLFRKIIVVEANGSGLL